MERGAGILCHISSLPGGYGIGSFGKEAFDFAQRLSEAGVKYWQVLPLVQTGFGDSPYQSVSCTSGNPYFIDLNELGERGLLSKKELSALRKRYPKTGKAEFGALYEERFQTLRTAFSRFHFDDERFRAFVEEGSAEDYSLFMTAKSKQNAAFQSWERGLKFREPEAIEKLKTECRDEYLFWQFVQFVFWTQWGKLKEFCNRLGVKIIGDLPLYVASDSADVWANPELFCLDQDLYPQKAAGVPPDYFSATGQLWGNPVYRWEAHEKTGFRWWTNRLENALKTYDLVRIDHFRGIDEYYEIPACEKTAERGKWAPGPKDKLFSGISGKGRIIAEDLGSIGESVRALLKKCGFPGMKVLLFAFDGNPQNPFLPHLYPKNCVCYTGTHDNDTVCGYVKSLSFEEFVLFRSRVAEELERCGLNLPLGENPASFARALIQLGLKSEADLCVIPIQDLMEKDNSCRMNTPGTREGNWKFRITQAPSAKTMSRLRNSIKQYRR